MNRTRFASLLLVPLAVLLMGAAVLVDPPPISVPAGLALANVSKAIRSGVVAPEIGANAVASRLVRGIDATVMRASP